MSKRGKDDAAMQRWIEETRRFQRIAGVPESSEADLARDWGELRQSRNGSKRKTANSGRSEFISE